MFPHTLLRFYRTCFHAPGRFRYPLLFLACLLYSPLSQAAPVNCSNEAVTEIPRLECEALVALYNATGGSTWGVGTDWNTATTVSAWIGVELSTTVPLRHVSKLTLNASIGGGGFFSGTLNGTLPAELGNLSQLTYLDLSQNNLSGSIPAALFNLSTLQTLSLYNNQLSGTIPSSLGGASALTWLALNNNNLAGSIPEGLGNLTGLTTLLLQKNQLDGPIPSGLANLTQLNYLDLSQNMLAGTIPSGIGQLTQLTTLLLYNNQLSGPIPADIGGLNALTWLNLSENALSGPIPSGIGNLSGLTVLLLHHNQLSGDIPPALAKLTLLTTLDLSYNQLSASDAGLLTFLATADSDWAKLQTLPAPVAFGGFAQSNYNLRETAGNAAIAVQRTNCTPDSGAFSLAYTIAAGSAVQDEDYIDTSGTLSWDAGICSDKNIVLSLLDDTVYEGTEHFFIRLNGSTENYAAEAVISILDGEDQVLPAAVDPASGLLQDEQGNLYDALSGYRVESGSGHWLTAQGTRLDPLTGLSVDNSSGLVFNTQGQLFEPLTGAVQDTQGQLVDPVSKQVIDVNALDIGYALMKQAVDRLSPAALYRLKSIVNQWQAGWEINPDTGEIFPPPNTALTIPARKDPQRPAKINTVLPDFDKGVAVAGSNAGGSVLADINQALAAGGLNCQVSQDHDGLLSAHCGATLLSFVPGNAVQAPAGTPPGLGRNEAGNYTVTTAEGRQFTVIAGPKDLRALATALNVSLAIDTDGVLSVVFSSSPSRARSERQQHVRADATQRPNSANEPPGLYIDGGNSGHIVYPDNTAQTVYATVPAPQTFLDEARKFPGVSKILYKSDGTFDVTYQGSPLKLTPQFDPMVKTLTGSEPVQPSITVNPGPTLTYKVQQQQQEIATMLTVE